ncbi:MAG TPA: type II secretion system protein [Candidatus Saccharimonadales bacterium]
MKGGQRARGFTITETLIVLAVTGGLFLVVAASLSGRQAKTQFEQGINEVRSQIQQTINEVGAGFYPNTNNFSCTAGGSGPVFAAAGSTDQGENVGCTFLGKAIQFKVGSSDPEIMKIYTIAGLQRTTAGDEPTDYDQAEARVVAPSTSSPSTPDASEVKPLLYGLTTTGTNTTGTIAFVNKLSASADSIISGEQQVNVIPVTNTPYGLTQQVGAQRINSNLGSSTVNPAGGVSLCFKSGGTNQSGLITIGSNGRQLSVTLSIRNGTSC